MQAVILAAGRGVRMRPLSHDRPKSLLNVAGRPVLDHLLHVLAAAGVEDVVLVVGHGGDRVQSYVGDGSRFRLRVQYVRQEKQLGPGHALMQARDLLEPEFVLLPADAWYHARLVRELLRGDGPALLQVHDARSRRHGMPVVRGGRATGLLEEEDPEARGHPSGGAYCMPRRVVEAIRAPEHALRDAIRVDMGSHGAWRVVEVADDEYVDLIDVSDALSLNGLLLRDVEDARLGTVEEGAHVVGPVHLGEGSVVRSGSVVVGPAWIGDDCDIGPLAVVQPGSSVRNHVRVGPFALLRRCSVASNVDVGSYARVQDAYVDNGARLEAGAKVDGGAGAAVGSDAHLGLESGVEGDGRVGRGARVAARRVVRDVPDGGQAV